MEYLHTHTHTTKKNGHGGRTRNRIPTTITMTQVLSCVTPRWTRLARRQLHLAITESAFDVVTNYSLDANIAYVVYVSRSFVRVHKLRNSDLRH